MGRNRVAESAVTQRANRKRAQSQLSFPLPSLCLSLSLLQSSCQTVSLTHLAGDKNESSSCERSEESQKEKRKHNEAN